MPGRIIYIAMSEPTINSVNETVGELSTKVDTVLDAMSDFSTRFFEHFDRLEALFDKIESKMNTKDYLDEKLINLKSV